MKDVQCVRVNVRLHIVGNMWWKRVTDTHAISVVLAPAASVNSENSVKTPGYCHV